MQIKEIRRKNPDELERMRVELLRSLQQRTHEAARRLETSKDSRLVLTPQQQQDNDTCLFACLISAKRAFTECSGRKYFAQEKDVADRARQAGILRNGGTLANHKTQDFIRSQFDLETVVSVETAKLKLDLIVNALEEGNVPLLSYSLRGGIGHWIAISDFRLNDSQLDVIAMNPLNYQNFETIDCSDFVAKLAGGECTDTNVGTSQLMIVKSPVKTPTLQSQFVVSQRRHPGMQVHERRPGKT